MFLFQRTEQQYPSHPLFYLELCLLHASRIVIIAGDISPIDVITHMPVVCEEADVPYCFVPSKQDLGAAGQTKRPTSIILIKNDSDIEGYKELSKEVAALIA